MERMWINQPSTLQPYHNLHGVRVLAIHEYDSTWQIYFLSGDVISQQIDRLALSDGWPPTSVSRDRNLSVAEMKQITHCG